MNKKELIEKVDSLQYSLSWNIPRINKETVLDLINKLDEPQPLKLKDIISRMKQLFPLSRSEWIDEILKEFGEEFGSIKYRSGYEQGKLEGIVEREKVTVPQFVAEYIEFQKKNNFHVYGAMRIIEDHYDKRVPEWFYEGNIEKFCLAWIFGYEVEKEPKYIVKLKNGQPLVKAPLGGKFYFNQNITAGNYKATRKELEEADFGWVFDCEGIEIEEVE